MRKITNLLAGAAVSVVANGIFHTRGNVKSELAIRKPSIFFGCDYSFGDVMSHGENKADL